MKWLGWNGIYDLLILIPKANLVENKRFIYVDNLMYIGHWPISILYKQSPKSFWTQSF